MRRARRGPRRGRCPRRGPGGAAGAARRRPHRGGLRLLARRGRGRHRRRGSGRRRPGAGPARCGARPRHRRRARPRVGPRCSASRAAASWRAARAERCGACSARDRLVDIARSGRGRVPAACRRRRRRGRGRVHLRRDRAREGRGVPARPTAGPARRPCAPPTACDPTTASWRRSPRSRSTGPRWASRPSVPDARAPGTLTAAALADAAAAVDATVVFASPAALRSVVATARGLTTSHRAALGKIRLVVSAGAPVPAALLHAVGEILPARRLPHPLRHDRGPARHRHLARGDRRGRAGRTASASGGRCPGSTVQISPLSPLGTPDGPLDRRERAHRGDLRQRGPREGPLRPAVGDRARGLARSGLAPHGRRRTPRRQGQALDRGPHRARDRDGGRADHAGRHRAAGRRPSKAWRPLPSSGWGRAGRSRWWSSSRADDRPGRVRLGSPPKPLTSAVRAAAGVTVAAVLQTDALPVDIRHASKVDRRRVAEWAERVLAGRRTGRRP